MRFSPLLLFHDLHWDPRVAIWRRRNVIPQRFPPASLGWKRICHIHAQPVRKRGVPGVHETPSVEWPDEGSNVYLVTTAWLTARRKDGEAGIFDLGALKLPLAVGAGLAIYGLEAANSQTVSKDGYPAGAYFIFGPVALLFAAGDC